MVNTTCPRCGGYFDSMVQEMCDTCLADELATLHATIEAKDAEMKRMTVEVEAWRSGQLELLPSHARTHCLVRLLTQIGWTGYDTITEAVDALVAERGGEG